MVAPLDILDKLTILEAWGVSIPGAYWSVYVCEVMRLCVQGGS